jgi:sugar-specific transcriptional regulator TrmB
MDVVEVLKSFGLSDYEAKALLALLSRGTLTAKEIAEIARIPRTSVYDVMNSLMARGFVESFGKPLRFKALSSSEIIALLSKKLNDGLEFLKRELPKIEAEEVEEVKVYRGDLVLEKFKEFVSKSKDVITVLLTTITDEIAKILNSAKCKLVVISSNPNAVKADERYKFRDKEFSRGVCHGLVIFDDNRVMFLFMNNQKLAIVGEGYGVIQFSKMLVTSLIEYLR